MTITVEELLLYLQCLNEVLRGFGVDNFDQTLGVPYSTLLAEDVALRDLHKHLRSRECEAHIRPEVIEETLRELQNGIDEFQTRTGFKVSEGEALLKKAKSAHPI